MIKLLKAVGLCRSGGEAKACVDDREVEVDGEIETRKRRKLRRGDVVVFRGNRVEII